MMAWPALSSDRLEALALDVAHRSRRSGGADGPTLVALSGDPAATTAEALCVDGIEPTDLRFVTPAAWWGGLAIVCSGWVTAEEEFERTVDRRSLAIDGLPPSRRPGARKSTIVHAVSTAGPTVLVIVDDHGNLSHCHTCVDPAAPDGPVGPLLEAMHRMLGLATPPPPVTTLEFWATQWLADAAALVEGHADAVVPRSLLSTAPAGARRRPGRQQRRRSAAAAASSWPVVASLHVAVDGWEDATSPSPPDRVGTPAERIVSAGLNFAAQSSWSDLRLLSTFDDGSIEGRRCSEVAAWVDDGMFARIWLRGVPPIWSSIRVLARRCDARVLAQVQATLAAWDVDFAPPGAPAPGDA